MLAPIYASFDSNCAISSGPMLLSQDQREGIQSSYETLIIASISTNAFLGSALTSITARAG